MQSSIQPVIDTLVPVVVERGVATITLNSPGNRNALSIRLLEDLHRALDRVALDDVRVVVLSHAPPVFCAGADLRERAAGGSDSGPLVDALRRIEDLRVPTIAAITGAVRAGGLGLMAACDLIVIAPTVDFAFAEVRIGVAPAIISVPLLRRVPWPALAAGFLTGEKFDATNALRIGLVTHVSQDVAGAVESLVAGILASAPGAVAATKHLLRGGARPDRDQAYAEMQQLSDDLFESSEGVEGMQAFLE